MGLRASLSEDSSEWLGGECLLLLQLGGRILFKSQSSDVQRDGSPLSSCSMRGVLFRLHKFLKRAL